MIALLWFVITLFGIIGFMVFIAPDFVSRQVVFIFGALKAIQIERLKRRDLKLFEVVDRVYVGKRDWYILRRMLLQIASAMMATGVALSFLGFWLVGNISIVPPRLVPLAQVAASFVLFGLFSALSVRLFRRASSIHRKLSNYDEYRQDIVHRWGKDDVAKISAGNRLLDLPRS